VHNKQMPLTTKLMHPATFSTTITHSTLYRHIHSHHSSFTSPTYSYNSTANFWIALLPASDNLLMWPSPTAAYAPASLPLHVSLSDGMFSLDPIHMGSGTASGTTIESLVVRHIPFTDVTSCKLPDPLGHHLCNSILCLSFTC
jgi:hypothetical protein